MLKRSPSLNRRLKLLLVVCFVPLTVVIIYLMVILNQFSWRYDGIVSYITAANTYNIQFKEDMDYAMYVIVVNSERAQELIGERQPHDMIAEARETFKQLYDTAEANNDSNARSHLQRLLKSLNILEDSVTEIENDAQVVGMYETNLDRLDLNVRILTELIQEQIQKYIYYEATNLEALREDIRVDVKNAIAMSIVIICVILMGALMLSRKILTRITEGIQQLRSVTKKAGKGEFTVRARLDDNDAELKELGDGFNQMVERIGNLVEDIRIEQLNLRLTEQKLLQAQINPHFLYNTLDAIIWLAEANQSEQVIMMVSALSDFFRTTLSQGRDYISVQEEEAHICSYLQIQQFRYQDILDYEIHISPELYQFSILKLMLQPLVENALYHGIKKKRGKGYIRVEGRYENDKMIFVVRDNGMGMTEERLEQVRKSMSSDAGGEQPAGFGLCNVAQRIRLNYGKEYGIQADSTYGEGTSMQITLPAIKN